MLRYPASITPDESGFLVLFPDIPEAITCGNTYEDALDMAADALVTSMDFYFEDGRCIPEPSGLAAGQVLIDLPESVSKKAILLNESLAQAKAAGSPRPTPQNL